VARRGGRLGRGARRLIGAPERREPTGMRGMGVGVERTDRNAHRPGKSGESRESILWFDEVVAGLSAQADAVLDAWHLMIQGT